MRRHWLQKLLRPFKMLVPIYATLISILLVATSYRLTHLSFFLFILPLKLSATHFVFFFLSPPSKFTEAFFYRVDVRFVEILLCPVFQPLKALIKFTTPHETTCRPLFVFNPFSTPFLPFLYVKHLNNPSKEYPEVSLKKKCWDFGN